MSPVKSYEAAEKALLREHGELLEERTGGLTWQEASKRYSDDLEGFQAFVREQCGVESLTEKQVEMAASYLDHRKTVVRGANATGKDFGACLLAMFACFVEGRRVVYTSFVERQVKVVGFGLFRQFLLSSDLNGELFTSALWADRDRGVGIIGYTSTAASGVTGIHHDRGTLIVLSECQGIEDDVWGGLLANTTGEADRIMAVGNPLSPTGMFYQVSHSPDWHAIKIPAYSHPNLRDDTDLYIPGAISSDWVEETIRFYGRDHQYTRARIDAEFPEDADHGLFKRSWLNDAVALHRTGQLQNEAHDNREPWRLAVDVARFGADQTVVAVMRGNVLDRFVSWGGVDTEATVERVLGVAGEIPSTPFGPERPVRSVTIDTVGIGAGVYDRLRSKDTPFHVASYKGSERAKKRKRFKNKRAESYWRLRKALEEGELALPQDEALFEELLAVRWQDDGQGRVMLERKSDLQRRLGGKSPDRADALAMCFAKTRRRLTTEEMIIRWG